MLKDTEVLYGKGKSALFWSASLANMSPLTKSALKRQQNW